MHGAARYTRKHHRQPDSICIPPILPNRFEGRRAWPGGGKLTERSGAAILQINMDTARYTGIIID